MAAGALIFTFPGVPLVYNGDEVGNDRQLNLMDKVDIDWEHGSEFRNFYARLAHVRREHAALREGDYRPIWCSDSTRVLAFERRSGHDDVCVVINFSKDRKTVQIESGNDLTEVLSEKTLSSVKGKVNLSLASYGFLILLPTQKGTQK